MSWLHHHPLVSSGFAHSISGAKYHKKELVHTFHHRLCLLLFFSWTLCPVLWREAQLWLFQAPTLAKELTTSRTPSQSPGSPAVSSTADTKSPRGKESAERQLAFKRSNIFCFWLSHAFDLQDRVRDDEQRRGEERAGLSQSEGRRSRAVSSDL